MSSPEWATVLPGHFQILCLLEPEVCFQLGDVSTICQKESSFNFTGNAEMERGHLIL